MSFILLKKYTFANNISGDENTVKLDKIGLINHFFIIEKKKNSEI